MAMSAKQVKWVGKMADMKRQLKYARSQVGKLCTTSSDINKQVRVAIKELLEAIRDETRRQYKGTDISGDRKKGIKYRFDEIMACWEVKPVAHSLIERLEKVARAKTLDEAAQKAFRAIIMPKPSKSLFAQL